MCNNKMFIVCINKGTGEWENQKAFLNKIRAVKFIESMQSNTENEYWLYLIEEIEIDDIETLGIDLN